MQVFRKMEDIDWSYIKPDTTKSLASKFLRSTALEGLVLDLQVISADLRNSQKSLSDIENSLQELEVWLQVQLPRTSQQDLT